MLTKVYISYFYQIRFFTPKYLPISTAVWDPKWYHNNKGPKYKYRDKNGVLIGVRSNFLHPGASCNGLCYGIESCKTKNPDTCSFLQKYKEQLDAIDIEVLLSNIEKYCQKVGAQFPVFIVHEAPTNACSERWPLFKWFKEHDIVCEEWRKGGQMKCF